MFFQESCLSGSKSLRLSYNLGRCIVHHIIQYHLVHHIIVNDIDPHVGPLTHCAKEPHTQGTNSGGEYQQGSPRKYKNPQKYHDLKNKSFKKILTLVM